MRLHSNFLRLIFYYESVVYQFPCILVNFQHCLVFDHQMTSFIFDLGYCREFWSVGRFDKLNKIERLYKVKFHLTVHSWRNHHTEMFSDILVSHDKCIICTSNEGQPIYFFVFVWLSCAWETRTYGNANICKPLSIKNMKQIW